MSEIGRCATCKHWRPFGAARSAFGHFASVLVESRSMGLCARVSAPDVGGEARPDPFDDFGNRVSGVPDPTLEAIADDMSSAAALRTAPEFGCTMHEAKA